MNKVLTDHLAWAGFAVASAILAWQPLHWLFRSWVSPAYGSHGYVYAAVIAALAVLSIASGATRKHRHNTPVLWLLVLAAALRLIGQVLAINLLSAFALAVDIFALVSLFGLASRPFALSPFWLAILFLFSLPVEMLVQRVLGFPLQLVSADGACHVLAALFDNVTCSGTRLTINTQDVLIDLPCSGASGLMLALALCVTLNAIYRPRFVVGCSALLATVALAICGNILRISVLASGIAFQSSTGIDVMHEPWHSAIGLVTLALSLLPLLLWYKPTPVKIRYVATRLPRLSQRYQIPVAALTLVGAVAITQAKARPVDISDTITMRTIPTQIGGYPAQHIALTSIERAYFTRYGGKAEKASFGPLGLNIVSTRSPLRHLHSPEACLRGLGYKTYFLGTRFEGDLPTAVYRAELDGAVWDVAVSYVSNRGETANGVAEAIWLWFQNPGATWSSIQRITPAAMPAVERTAMDAAALAALDIPTIKSDIPTN